MPEIGIVAALPAEAAAAPTAAGFQVIVSGPGQQRAGDAARRLLDGGATGLISWGVGGGLNPALQPGELVLAERVASVDGLFVPDPDWRRQAATSLQPISGLVTSGGVWTGVHAITSVADKHALARGGHDLVDMEAAAVATVASDAGVPFLAVKAVCDPADRALPAYAPRLLRGDGRVRVSALLTALARGPRTWRDLRRMHHDFDLACASLRKAAALLSLSCKP